MLLVLTFVSTLTRREDPAFHNITHPFFTECITCSTPATTTYLRYILIVIGKLLISLQAS